MGIEEDAKVDGALPWQCQKTKGNQHFVVRTTARRWEGSPYTYNGS